MVKEQSSTIFDLRCDAARLAGLGQFADARKLLSGAEYLSNDEVITDILRKSMIGKVGIVQQELVEMRWQFIRPSASNYFVTSDHPVVLDRGLGLKFASLIFPLDQNLLLLADHSGEPDLIYRGSSEDETLKLNVLTIVTANMEIYSPQPDKWIHTGWTEGFRFDI